MPKTNPDRGANRSECDEGGLCPSTPAQPGASGAGGDDFAGEGLTGEAHGTSRETRVKAATSLRPRRDTTARRERLATLASLLGDDSEVVWSGVRRQFELSGRAGLPTLMRATASESPRVRSRARMLVHDRAKTLALRRVLRYVTTRTKAAPLDLERALFLLARYHEPALDPRPFQRQLDGLAREVWKRAQDLGDPLQRAQVMVSYLGKELDYGGSSGDFHHPDNIHLHRVLERRAGMPLSLCAVYLLVGRRAGISAACLPLPGHVMLRLHGRGASIIVDPYHRGQLRTERDCRKYLEQNGLPVKAAWFGDADDALLFKRQVANLARSAQLRGLGRERRELMLLSRVLEPKSAVGSAAKGN
jgi:regulator of sirC expression with transglutaminase-like and TPR domain